MILNFGKINMKLKINSISNFIININSSQNLWEDKETKMINKKTILCVNLLLKLYFLLILLLIIL
jgi:hypothetical protein